MTQEVEIIGAERIGRNLRAIGRAAERLDTLQPGAEVLKDEMQDRVAKDSYQLHDSIDVRRRGDTLEVGAGPEGFYGYFLERGTSKMAAQPWLVPALDAARDRAVAAIGRQIGVKINLVWGHGR